MYGGWSLIARDPTRDHWAMSVVGLELAIARWIGGYAGDGAAWCRVGGVALMVLAGAAYIADEAGAVTESERIKALANTRPGMASQRRTPQRSRLNPSTLPTSISPANSSTRYPFGPGTVPTRGDTQLLPMTAARRPLRTRLTHR